MLIPLVMGAVDRPVRSLRVPGVLLLALAALLPGQARPAGGPFPTYVGPKANWTVVSNSSWRVLGAKAKVLRPHTLGYYEGNTPGSDVWAPTCASGAQTVVFTREIDVPGTPTTGVFVFYPSAFSFPMFDSAQ